MDIKKIKNINFKQNFELDIQTELSDDWIIKDLNSKPYFDSRKLNKRIIVTKSKILNIIGNLEDTTNSTNMLIINGSYGFINDEFYSEKEYIKNKEFIEDRLNIKPLKYIDLKLGNLYERPDGSIFIYLGERYIIKKLNKNDKKTSISYEYFSNSKRIYYVLEMQGSYINKLEKKNLKIYKELGENGIYDNESVSEYLNDYLSSRTDLYKVYNNSKVKGISLKIKELTYSKELLEELKQSKNLIIKSGDLYYKYLKVSKKTSNEKVSGRPLQEVYFEYELYQKINIEENKIKLYPKLGYDMLSSNSWYSSSGSVFEDIISFGNKNIYIKSESLNSDKKLYIIEYLEEN